jgi:aminopeptidase N
MRYCIVLLLISFHLSAQDRYHFQPIDVKHYAFHLQLNDQNNQIKGQTFVSILFKESNLEQFTIDLVSQQNSKGMRVNVVREEGRLLSFSQEREKLIIELDRVSSKDELRTFEIAYAGEPADGLIIGKNKYGERTFFGDNWANRAHHWLPTIDHPSDKATCEFKVTAPMHYEVIANGRKVEESYLSDSLKFTHWKTEVPIPTKVMVIGVARFAVHFLGTYKGISIESWVYPQNREAGFADYSLAKEVLQFFDSRIGAYPYEKLANVQSKTKYGGMENASNIFYYENSITGMKSEQIERLIAHEVAHQWFGNAISEKRWQHVWISEGFATYFTELYMEHKKGQKAMQESMKKLQNQVVLFHESYPELPVVFEKIHDLNDILNTNSYQKGACVLHTLRYEMGDSLFWQSIRTYYEQFQHQNVTTEDFQKVVEQISEKNWDWFFKQWLYKAGHPKIKTTWEVDRKGKQVKIKIVQKQADVFILSPNLCVYGNNGELIYKEKISLKNRETHLTIPVKEEVQKVVLDPENWILMEKE